ncbi:MFS transporter [Sphingobium sp. SA2]|uniref:MFS transporter n=1 Tax=Sphingobium sp. SA2 TaxID=1524832 RepID=UPI0028C00D2B|nr:MFS transporter [Sphingobium sp. SA2]MDT7533132.1 MFS transporter [Sphingobium sp. SA2]
MWRAPKARPNPRFGRISGTTLSPLTHRLFTLLWVATLIGNFGNAFQAVGGSWHMTLIDDRPDMIALAQTAFSAPILVLAMIGGALADLHEPRRIMALAMLTATILSSMLVLLVTLGLLNAWALIALLFASGGCLAFYNPAMQVAIGHIVPREDIAGAVSLNILGFNVSRTLGPAIGGIIVAFGGVTAAFACTVATSLCAMVMLWSWHPLANRPPRDRRNHVWHAIGEGLNSIRSSTPLCTLLIRALAFTFCGSATWALMPLISRDLLQGGPQRFGMLLGALGLGAVIGAALSHRVRARYANETLVRAAGIIYGTSCLIVAIAPGFPVTTLALIVAGAGWVQALSGFGVMAQRWSPRPVIGRVSAATSSVIWGGMAAGSWGWGHVATAVGVAHCIALSGAAMILLAGLGLLLPLPAHEDATPMAGR